MSKQYPSLEKESENKRFEKNEIESLLKRARKNYITCKANRSQETGLWGQQCMVLRELLDGKRRVSDYFTQEELPFTRTKETI